ncbi:MAG: hypothetical protein Q7Q73_09440 [Verrucomicrobiota bacterium JB024]|nr:hypothetical protein [Verrucomicrobiota bacterium JB024]
MKNTQSSLVNILLSASLIVGCAATAQADVLFNYGSDSYVTGDKNFSHKATESGTGPYVFVNAFSDTTALSPTSGYTGPLFYGGYDFSSSNINPESGISRQQVRNNYQSYDQIFLKCTNFPDGWTGADLSLHAVFVFQQADYNSGYTTGDLSVDGLSVSWGSVNIGGDFDLAGRLVVQIGGTYYVSQTTFAMSSDGSFSLSGSALSTETWAVYNPTASINFDQSSAVYSSLDLDNVTATGLYFEDDLWSGGTYDAAFDLGIKTYEVSGTVIPEPAHMSVLLGIFILFGLCRRLRSRRSGL